MQTDKIFNELPIPKYYFNNKLLTTDLFYYFLDNLDNENYDTLRLDLENALTNNANEEYI
jgi:hypothetical protein